MGIVFGQYCLAVNEVNNKLSSKMMTPDQDQVDAAHYQGFIFISFSCPNELLRQLLIDADRYHFAVVLRGLINNDFKETFKKIYNLVPKNFHGGFMINPIWFKEFGINAVPSLVLLKNTECLLEEKCYLKDFDSIYGNISTKEALKIISNRGHAAKEIARLLLEK